MFTGMINLLPGQELKPFEVFRSGTRRTESGRVVDNAREKLGEIRAILAAAKPDEQQRWRQTEHPVSHKVIQQGVAAFEIRPGDFLEHGGKRYMVQTAPYNPGGINHWTIYYCDERSDT